MLDRNVGRMFEIELDKSVVSFEEVLLQIKVSIETYKKLITRGKRSSSLDSILFPVVAGNLSLAIAYSGVEIIE